LEAIGVHHHGLTRWKTTEPIAITIKASARAISFHPHHICARHETAGNNVEVQ
jgi:hypothetical protein